MPAQPIHFKNEGVDLFGMIHLPAGRRKKFPAVLFLHGFLSNRIEHHRIFVKMARLLEAQGIVSLRFDFRGCGESGGDTRDMTLSGMMSDTQAAFEWLSRHRFVNHKKVALLGMSLGSGMGAILAGRDPRPRALVLWTPVEDLMECLAIKAAGHDVKTILHSPQIDYLGNILSHEFFSEFELFQPLEAVKNFKGATLVIQGSEDKIVPPQQAEKYKKALKGRHPHNRQLTIEGADHIFASVPWETRVLETTADFFKKVLK